MGYTNTTSHYGLPQYVATDKPKYLTDYNETMVAIDTQMYANAQAAATADGKAVAAKNVADGAVSSIGTLNVQINGDPQDPTDTGLAGEVSGIDTDLNTVQSLIGSGTPTTSNQTIIGAINGLEGSVAPREDGDDLANSYSTGEQFARGGSVYEALTSLTAGIAFASLTLNTDYKVAKTLVEQIKEAGEGSTAAGTSYDNSASHLLADDVQEAIDEVAALAAAEHFEHADVDVRADGVKTVSTLISELVTAISTVTSGMTSGFALCSAFTLNGIEYPAGKIIEHGNNFGSMQIDASILGASDTTIYNTYLGSTSRTRKVVIESGSYTQTDLSSDVPADNTLFRCRMIKFT